MNLTIDFNDIAGESKRLIAEIKRLGAERDALHGVLAALQATCKHPGQERGWNERHGDWANPCPVCGASR